MNDTLTVVYTCEDQFEKIHTGALLGDLPLRDPKAPRAGLGNARQLLAAAVLSCTCSSLAATLDGKGLGDTPIRATATVRTESRSRGQRRIAGIDLEVTVFLDSHEADAMDDVQAALDMGCLVSDSLKPAIPVTATLRRANRADYARYATAPQA